MMYSSDEIWRGENQERSITQDLDQIETDIDNLEIGKAPANHTHTPASIGAAPTNHTHDYAAKNHTHTPSSIGAAPAEHSHDQYATLSKVYRSVAFT